MAVSLLGKSTVSCRYIDLAGVCKKVNPLSGIYNFCLLCRSRTIFFFYIDIIRSNYVDRVTIKYPVRVCFVKDGRRVMLINFLRKSMICDSISSKLFETIYIYIDYFTTAPETTF